MSSTGLHPRGWCLGPLGTAVRRFLPSRLGWDCEGLSSSPCLQPLGSSSTLSAFLAPPPRTNPSLPIDPVFSSSLFLKHSFSFRISFLTSHFYIFPPSPYLAWVFNLFSCPPPSFFPSQGPTGSVIMWAQGRVIAISPTPEAGAPSPGASP